MQKKTKIIIAVSVVAVVAVVAVIGLQVFIYSEKQKGLESLEAQINQNSQSTSSEQDLAPLPTATPDATPAPTEPPKAETTPVLEPSPAPSATPAVTPSATAAPKPTQKPTSTVPEHGDTRDNNGQTQKYIDGFGWVDYSGSGGTQTVADFQLSGNQVGQ